jgi:hypothetical protein
MVPASTGEQGISLAAATAGAIISKLQRKR